MNRVLKAFAGRSGLAVVLVASVMTLTGCDFFRSIVGKPTSKEIEQMRLAAEERLKEQQALDSAQYALEEPQQVTVTKEEVIPPISSDCPRYNVILGSFRVVSNADRMLKALDKLGYSPKSIQFKNGFKVVSAYQSNDIRDAKAAEGRMLELEICPEDVWIYDLNQGLHE